MYAAKNTTLLRYYIEIGGRPRVAVSLTGTFLGFVWPENDTEAKGTSNLEGFPEALHLVEQAEGGAK